MRKEHFFVLNSSLANPVPTSNSRNWCLLVCTPQMAMDVDLDLEMALDLEMGLERQCKSQSEHSGRKK